MELLDKSCLDSIDVDINQSIMWYMCATWALNEENPIITENVYNHIKRKIKKNWEIIDHVCKFNIDQNDFSIIEFPKMTEQTVKTLRSNL
jgi:hypothetical protein